MGCVPSSDPVYRLLNWSVPSDVTPDSRLQVVADQGGVVSQSTHPSVHVGRLSVARKFSNSTSRIGQQTQTSRESFASRSPPGRWVAPPWKPPRSIDCLGRDLSTDYFSSSHSPVASFSPPATSSVTPGVSRNVSFAPTGEEVSRSHPDAAAEPPPWEPPRSIESAIL